MKACQQPKPSSHAEAKQQPQPQQPSQATVRGLTRALTRPVAVVLEDPAVPPPSATLVFQSMLHQSMLQQSKAAHHNRLGREGPRVR